MMDKFNKLVESIVDGYKLPKGNSPIVKVIDDKSHPYYKILDGEKYMKGIVAEIDPSFFPGIEEDPEAMYANPFGKGTIRHGDIVDNYAKILKKKGKEAFLFSTFDEEPIYVKQDGKKFYINDGSHRITIAKALGMNIDAIVTM